MKRFSFRLEKILEIRKYHEREWELKLAEITGTCFRIKGEIRSLLSERGDAFQKRHLSLERDISYLLASELYMQRLEQSAEKLALDLQEKEKILDEVRKQYQEASKQRKILEKLKEKRQKENYKKQRDEEIKVIDDIALSNLTRVGGEHNGD
jgi:flagellar FliJ protein